MDYQEAMAYIEQLNKKGISLGLERMEALLQYLDNPQNDLRIIHVAGTNGKGSVCAFIESALQQAGLRIGRYISPSVYDYLERFQINGVYMDTQTFSILLSDVQVACAQMEQHGLELPTAFEVETAIAFLYFKQVKCDYVLLEVGMGGRLDSTNVITHPVLSVITSISMDHTGMLGNTLGEIAAEKAGIIKESCPVVLAWQKPEAMNVLLEKCKECHIEPIIADPLQQYDPEWNIYGQRFSYKDWKQLHIGLIGQYQQMNAIVALEALWVIQEWEPLLDDDAIRQGLLNARWPGRFEVILHKPLLIVDGSHNPAGAQALVDTIKYIPKENYAKCWLLMGVFADKEYKKIGQIMSDCSDTLICFKPSGDRGLKADKLAETMQQYYSNVIIEENAATAVKYVLEHASDGDMIISFGSLSTIKMVEDAVAFWEVAHNV